MKLDFNKIDYHISKKDASNDRIKNYLYEITFLTNPIYKKKIDSYFLKCKLDYSESSKVELIKKSLLSFYKEILEDDLNYDEKNLIKILNHRILKTFPIIISNERAISLNNNFIYEPRNAVSYYLLNKYQIAIAKYFLNKKECETFLDYKILLINNINRSLRSSLILLANCDDVHGISILRGTLELLARFRSLNEDNFLDYKLHVKMNAQLQHAKIHNLEIDESTPELFNLIKERNLKGGKLELYLLNSWCRNHNGKQISSTSDMIKHAFNKQMANFYDHASEFVHEDYIGVNYDYIFIREQCKNIISILVEELFIFLNHHLTSFTAFDKKVYLYLKYLHKDIEFF